ncbi:MAG TPA: PEP-CTERM sorting domain-containing protein [Pirellulales bacterium]|nr:PEP-CTERM sorting domain-containing protein [Pirellulales bacterium]
MSVILSVAQAAQVVTVNATVHSLGYSSVSGLVYGSIPNSSVTNPNTLLPMNPFLGTSGTGIPIGFDPQQIAVSYDGSNVYTIVDGSAAVQRYDVATQTADQFFNINGGRQFNAIYSIPNRPDAVLMHSFTTNQSPPNGVNTVYENGVALPNSWAGPDIVSVDPTNGTRGFGYVNSNTSFGSSLAQIGPTGIGGASGSQLSGVLANFGINQVVLVGDRLFDNEGAIYSVSLGVQIGAFQGAGNFVVDPTLDKFFSITTSGSTETIHAYSLDTLAPIGTDTVTGVSGSPFSLIRFGDNGLAFATTSGEVVFVQSQVVPEPGTIALAISGGLCLAGVCARQRRRRVEQG